MALATRSSKQHWHHQPSATSAVGALAATWRNGGMRRNGVVWADEAWRRNETKRRHLCPSGGGVAAGVAPFERRRSRNGVLAAVAYPTKYLSRRKSLTGQTGM